MSTQQIYSNLIKLLIITTNILLQCIRILSLFIRHCYNCICCVHTDSVKLNNFTSKCFGDVSIDVNGANYEVCYSDQDSIQSLKKMGEVVCRELGCGKVLAVKQGSSTSNGLLSNVECQDNEQSLWHCLAIREKKQCSRTKVICSGN